MIINLKIWRQKNSLAKGKFVDYQLDGVLPEFSFFETLDLLNQKLILTGEDPIAFDHDCREGICGMCALVINGVVHGMPENTTTCQLHMRSFTDGKTIVVEPLRAKPFPVIKDLIVDRSALDRIIAAGGFVSVNVGSAVDANTHLVEKDKNEMSIDAASCVGCGACVAACKNASAMLFVACKINQFALLPQGQLERKERVTRMIKQMDVEGFGNCTNEKECMAVCPKGIDVKNIVRMNREYLSAIFCDR